MPQSAQSGAFPGTQAPAWQLSWVQSVASPSQEVPSTTGSATQLPAWQLSAVQSEASVSQVVQVELADSGPYWPAAQFVWPPAPPGGMPANPAWAASARRAPRHGGASSDRARGPMPQGELLRVARYVEAATGERPASDEALRRAFAPLGFSVSPAPNDAGLSMGGAYAAVRATRAHAQRTELLGFDVWDHADEAMHAGLRGGAGLSSSLSRARAAGWPAAARGGGQAPAG
jgi:hypothetical protein